MTTETELKKDLETYVAAEPPLGFDAGSVRRTARRQQRRTRVVTITGAACAMAAVTLAAVRLSPAPSPSRHRPVRRR